MKFSQAIRIRTQDPERIVELLAEWDRGQAEAEVMGYIGTRLLADRDNPGEYMILAEFAQVDEDVSSAEEAEINNQRTETDQWARSLREAVEGEPEFFHFDELYRTGITGDLRTG
ncbi:MAG: hypothetical protein GY812_13475 [Actinomycetia bacterium]|nr:hypothetical protein [Actinomycetes bacterium]